MKCCTRLLQSTCTLITCTIRHNQLSPLLHCCAPSLAVLLCFAVSGCYADYQRRFYFLAELLRYYFVTLLLAVILLSGGVITLLLCYTITGIDFSFFDIT